MSQRFHAGRLAVGMIVLASLVSCQDQSPQDSTAAGRAAGEVDRPSSSAPPVPGVNRAEPPSGSAIPSGQAGQNVPTLPVSTAAAERSTTAGSNWPGFRGPGGMGVAGSTGLPLEWSETKNVVWKTALPGSGASSAVTWGDRIYVTCYTGYFVPHEPGGRMEDLQRHLLALDRDTGKILWNTPVPAKLPEEERIRDHGFAASTPAVDADRIYVFFGKSGVFAFDHKGQQQWQADVGSRTHGWGSAASPVLHGDLVFINASVESTSLVALNRRTGEEVWRARGVREAWNTPLVVTSAAGRRELLVARQGAILAFQPEDGTPLWTCETDISWYMVPTPVAAEGVVYYLGGRSGISSLAVRTGGSGEVTGSHRLWTTRNGSNVSSPLYHNGHLYWANDAQGIAFCVHAESGDVVYQQRLDRIGQVYASPVLADGRVYYLGRGGKTIVLAGRPEFEQLAVNTLEDGSRFDAAPAVDGDRLLIRSEKFLYCLGQ